MEKQGEQNSGLCSLNLRNEVFWTNQNELFMRRLADESVREVAFAAITHDLNRQISILNISMHQALLIAENAKKRFLSESARRGGKAEKGDPLERLIFGLVWKNPDLTLPQLILELRKCQETRHVVQDLNDRTLTFQKKDGTLKTIKISVLKDRLYRAKNKFRSR